MAEYRLSSSDKRHIEAVEEQLAIWRPGEPILDEVLAHVRPWIGLESLLVISPVVVSTGLQIERFHSDGFANGANLERLFATFFVNAPPTYAWYNAARPEAWQRNRVLDARDLMTSDELEQSNVGREVLRPAGLTRHRQPRALLCDGSTLLTWFGAFHDGNIESRHTTLLRRLVPPMRKRVAMERRLQVLQQQEGELATALEQLTAAFLVDRRLAVFAANAAGQALLARDRRGVSHDIAAAMAGRPGSLTFDVVPIAEPGDLTLLVLRASRQARIVACVQSAADRWSLSPRQREVLLHIVDGAANLSIALELDLSIRAVEQNVTALFCRAGVSTRAELVMAALVDA